MIVRSRGYRYSLAYTRPIAGNEMRDGLLFVLSHDDGQHGLGECAPWPAFDGVTLDDAETRLSSEDGEVPGCVQWGLACAERPWEPLAASVPSAVLLWEDDDTRFDQRLRDLADATAAPPAVKLKIARTPSSEALDLDRIRRVHELLPTTELRLDANRALDVATVRRMHDACDGMSISFWEEPCADVEDHATLAADGIPIALDESLLTEGAFDAGVRAEAYVLKPSLLGPERCRELVQDASQASTRIVVSSVFESRIGRMALARFAHEVAPETAHGLGTAAFLAEDFQAPEQHEVDDWLEHLVHEGFLQPRFDVEI